MKSATFIKIVFIAILAMFSFAATAHPLCEGQGDYNGCMNMNYNAFKNMIGKNVQNALQSPSYSKNRKEWLMSNQQIWEQAVTKQCGRNIECYVTEFVERNYFIKHLPADVK